MAALMRMVGIAVLIVAFLSAGLARAQEPAKDDFNFDFAKPAEPEKTQAQKDDEAQRALKFDERVHLRRRMLVAHQAFGFVTLGLLAATLVLGTLNYVDKYGGGTDDGRYYNWHLGLASAASGTFATTAILALAAPNPYPKPIKLDAALLHKVMMGFAAASFIAQIILGPIAAAHEGQLDQRGIAIAHLVTGYAAFGFMFTGTMAYVAK
jgi:hypothetical protein